MFYTGSGLLTLHFANTAHTHLPSASTSRPAPQVRPDSGELPTIVLDVLEALGKKSAGRGACAYPGRTVAQPLLPESSKGFFNPRLD